MLDRTRRWVAHIQWERIIRSGSNSPRVAPSLKLLVIGSDQRSRATQRKRQHRRQKWELLGSGARVKSLSTAFAKPPTKLPLSLILTRLHVSQRKDSTQRTDSGAKAEHTTPSKVVDDPSINALGKA